LLALNNVFHDFSQSSSVLLSERTARDWELVELDLNSDLGEIQWEFHVASSTENIYLENIVLNRTTTCKYITSGEYLLW